MKRRPHEDLYCMCEACTAWDEFHFAKCACLCGDCKVKFINELRTRGEALEDMSPETDE